ncbi:hypothetical protein B1NLA3E_19780 [Bacillus sp. 1NLA3E]|nr:hypothetical protein B1NLA3E_19780 [Bacillus sp. 1NLA3E]
MPFTLTFAQPLDSKKIVNAVPFLRVAMTVPLVDALVRKFNDPLLTLTYLIVTSLTIPGWPVFVCAACTASSKATVDKTAKQKVGIIAFFTTLPGFLWLAFFRLGIGFSIILPLFLLILQNGINYLYFRQNNINIRKSYYISITNW